MVKCLLKFHNDSNGVFYSGQEVSGTVSLHNKKPIMTKEVLLKVRGTTLTSWKDTTVPKKERESYSATEIYIRTNTTLMGNGEGKKGQRNKITQRNHLPIL